MKLTLPAASLLALALFTVTGLAQDQPAMQLAQAAVPAEAQALLDDKRPLAEMTVKELTQRIRRARVLMQTENLPRDVRRQLQAAMRAASKERTARQQAGEQPAATETEADTSTVQAEPEAPAEQPATTKAQVETTAQAEPAAPAATEVPADAQAYLDDTRAAADLTANELRTRIRLGTRLAQLKGLPAPTRQKIRGQLRADRAARQSKPAAGEQAETTTTQEQPATTQEEPAEATAETTRRSEDPAELQAYLTDTRAAADLPAEELRTRIRLAQRLARSPGLPGNTRQQIRQRIRADRAQMQSKPPAAEPTEQAEAEQEATATRRSEQTKPDEKDVSNLDRNTGDAEAEARAKAILANTRQPNQMSDAELRKSLADIRALMSENRLSRDTERLLRQRLAAERRILRNRVTAERREEQPDRRRSGRRDDQIDPKYLIDIEIVLRDNRRSEDLADRELRRRIEVYLRAMEDERYEAAERARWRQFVERDRRFLRQRLVDFRSVRQAELRAGDNEIEIGVDLGGRDFVIDAAESDDEDIEDVLVAAPRRQPDRRYSVEEIENSEELRDSLPRVEIDTIRFGFNESFVREEEVDNLDRVGETIERILAAHPREVFLVEGHTDAVGSDPYNLALSRQRAVAVKEALAEYFVIPPENLRTAGYGERFLKIPTAEEEQENRRVSVSRATALIGELEQ